MAVTEWMGRYRGLIETIVRHRNAFARVMNTKTESSGNISLSIIEWEVLEYIIEHETDDSSMAQLSDHLMIPPSSFSKICRTLLNAGLIERYRMEGNKKNIILKPSRAGIAFYRDWAVQLDMGMFTKFFGELENFSDEDLRHIATAIESITPRIDDSDNDTEKNRKLIKMDRPFTS